MEKTVLGLQKKKGEEIEHLRREYKERSERLERTIPTRNVPRGQSLIELLTPRKLSQTTEVRVPTAADRVIISRGTDGAEANRNGWTTCNH